MALKKQKLKKQPICKVTFSLKKKQINGAKAVFVVGDFNNWDHFANPMTILKNGNSNITLELETGRDYAFRYRLDNGEWLNDEAADAYVFNGISGDNCVISLLED